MDKDTSTLVNIAVLSINHLEPGDHELAHLQAERYLLDFLHESGHSKIVEAYYAAKERCSFQYA